MYKSVLLMFLISYQNIISADSTIKPADKQKSAVILSSNIASNNFYQILAKGNENVLFCPLSLNILLALLTIAARGLTANEIKTALNLNIENEDIESGYKELLSNLQDEILKIATRIYPKIEVSLMPEFIKTAQTYFNSDVQKLNYSNGESAAKTINTFVQNITNNKIHELVTAETLPKETVVLLVNAVYFKEDWLQKFKNIHLKQTFYLSEDKKVETEMMEYTEYYNYKEIISLDARVLEIPYKKQEYSMFILLPNKIDGLHEVENKLKLTNFEEIYNNLTRSYVKVTLPKFKMEKTIVLNDVCKEVGIQTMFTSEANLSGLTKDNAYVSSVIQKTYIKVDEHGAEAAAATAVITSLLKMSDTNGKSQPIVFTADHPFIFVLMKGKIILFLGRLSQL